MSNHSHRVLYVLASNTWGGGEQYVFDLMNALQIGGYECYAITPRSKVNTEKLFQIAPHDHVRELRMGSMFDIVSALRMARIIKKRQIDIVHVNKFADAFLALWARLISGRNVRIVMTRHLIRRGKTSLPYRFLYNRLDKLIFVSELAKREFMSRNPKIDQDKIRVIHNGIADAWQAPLARSNDAVTIAFVGRIVEEKGLVVLMEALARLTAYNFRIKLIGTGPEEYIDELKRIATRNALAQRLVFTGFTDNVNAALQEASIGVQPSIVREGFPISVLEYMRSGLAIVASDNGGQAECLSDGKDSFLVPPGDIEKLAEVIEILLKDPEKCSEMGENARKAFLAELTYDRFLERMTNLYDGLCV